MSVRQTRLKREDGPRTNQGGVTTPLGHAQWMLIHVIPHAYANSAHYDQRRLMCVACGNVPKRRGALTETEAGYVCKMVGSCAKRAEIAD